VAENHGETYLDKCRQYATNYAAIKRASDRGLVNVPAFIEPPKVMDIPRHRWFMKVYQLDVISRIDFELAELTSIFGEILKIDSTKKITNKLAGKVLRLKLRNGLQRIHICIFYQNINKNFLIKMLYVL